MGWGGGWVVCRSMRGSLLSAPKFGSLLGSLTLISTHRRVHKFGLIFKCLQA